MIAWKRLIQLSLAFLWTVLIFVLDPALVYYTVIIGIMMMGIQMMNLTQRENKQDMDEVNWNNQLVEDRIQDRETDPETSTSGVKARMPDSW